MKDRSDSHPSQTGGAGAREYLRSVSGILVLCLALFVLHALANFTRPPSSYDYNFLSRVWGIDNISYYPAFVVIAFYAMLVLVCIPTINQTIVRFLLRLGYFSRERKIFSTKTKRWFWLLGFGLVFLALFRLLQIKYNFLGDMDIRVHQTVEGQYQSTEYATMWLLHWIYEQIHRSFGVSGLQLFQWSSSIFGVFFVWLSVSLATLVGKNTIQRLLISIATVTIGTLQFFFGYAEIYPFPALTVLLFVVTGVLYAKNRVGGLVLVLAFALAVSAHLLSIVFLPSLVFLLVSRHQGFDGVIRKVYMRHLVGILLAAIPAAYVVLPALGQGYYLIPWSENPGPFQATTLLSAVHVWEFLNSQLLAAGGGFVLYIVVVLRFIRTKRTFDTVEWFLALSAGFLFISAFITNTVRGSGDWDILAFPAIVCVPWAVYTYLNQARSKSDISRSYGVLVVLLSFNVLSTSAWIGINASDRSIKKIEDMLIGDPGNYYKQTLPVAMSLAFNYETNGLGQKALQYFRISVDRYPQDPRSYFNYATHLIAIQQDSAAIPYLEYLVNNFPGYPRSFEVLIGEFVRQKNYPASARVIERLFGYYIQNPRYYQSVFPKQQLANWFSYLLQFANAGKNEKEVREIQQQLSQLQ